MAQRKQFTLRHLAILVTLICLGLGIFRGWYTAERNCWFEANTSLHRVERKVFGFTVSRWFERSQLHLELLELIHKHDLEYDETWLPLSSYSRQHGVRGYDEWDDWQWSEMLARIYLRSDNDGEEEIGVELLKIYLPVEKTKENIEPTRQRLLKRLNELIAPKYSLSF